MGWAKWSIFDEYKYLLRIRKRNYMHKRLSTIYCQDNFWLTFVNELQWKNCLNSYNSMKSTWNVFIIYVLYILNEFRTVAFRKECSENTCGLTILVYSHIIIWTLNMVQTLTPMALISITPQQTNNLIEVVYPLSMSVSMLLCVDDLSKLLVKCFPYFSFHIVDRTTWKPVKIMQCHVIYACIDWNLCINECIWWLPKCLKKNM